MKIKKGSGRTAFIFKNKTIKFARNKNGLEQNRIEWDVFCQYPELVTHIYKRVGKRILIHETVKPMNEIGLTHVELMTYPKYATIHTKLVQQLGRHKDNLQIGVTKQGKFVCYDYGKSPKYSE